ncbi:hypothetical protein CARUB_v10020764mg [Capsella rubella]|uniref:FAF domain-containing protein n=1 Tax=Capsella rubella TaxID=81985 RepID=R0I063_9BRAS|nr:protein FANTASTIC FOUR 1 [Capsella rubella]EOA35549.1 hypothetical protein CARUB_v10020764mg [Capsella rubella]
MSFYQRSFHSCLDKTNNTKKMLFEYSGLGHDEVNRLMLCTEYLGFESYDMRMSENEVEDKMKCCPEVENERVETKRRKMEENVVAREGKREFPPPLSTLNGLGQRSFYLRPVRKDGRLELTQVMIDRPEIFHASRENGRLRLHLVDSAYCDPEETVELEDEPKGLDNEHEVGEINEEDNDATSDDDQVVDLSMINDDNGTRSWISRSSHEVSVNSNDVAHIHDDHVHDTREWCYKSCYKIMASMSHDETNHHHHHIHPYHHHNSNNNMHVWTGAYVKTR